MPDITLEREGHVLLIGLNRPAKRNAFHPAMFRELARALGEYGADPALRCAVLFAHGPHFTGGIDLEAYAPLFAEGDPFAPKTTEGVIEIDPFGLRSRLSKPLVVAVQGISFTIAIELLLAADIRIAASNVRFAQLEIARGLYPLGGATFRLAREAGWGNAMRWLLTAEEFGAQEAMRLGLVQEIVEPGEELPRARAIAQRIAAMAPLGVKATIDSARTERTMDHLPAILTSADFAEGVASFRERRPAIF